MDAVYAVSQEIGNLVDGVGDADIAHGFGSVTVFGNGPLEFDRERSAAHGDHAFDLSFVSDGHDAGFDGNIDTGDFTTFEEAVEKGVVEEELGNEFASAGVDFGLQVADVGGQGLSFGMPFRVAGADDVEFRRLFFDEGHKVAGVFEVVRPFAARDFIATQGQDVFDAGFFQFFQVLQGCFFRQVDAGHVSGCFAAQGFDAAGDFDRAVAAGTAGAAGDADEVRMEFAQFFQRRIDRFDGNILLRRKDFKRKDRFFGKKLVRMHILFPP